MLHYKKLFTFFNKAFTYFCFRDIIEQMFDIEGGAGMAVTQEIFEKLEILTDAAKYDVACTSSGAAGKGDRG